jgi:hypothetical protein
MGDPDGLSQEQRALVNVAHQAIVVFTAVTGHESAGDAPDERQVALQRARAAIGAAREGGLHPGVLERTIKAATAVGREHAG